jgi:hypothetical protein
MSIGAVLIGIGALAVVVAYVAQPFRTATGGAGLDRAIETWVAQVRNGSAIGDRAQVSSGSREASVINFCPECGRRVAADDRFCSGCGKRLRGSSS